MTTFQDGPANGNHLALKRAPIFLRVTESAGKFDALDQVEDTPRADEKLFAYEIVERGGMCHINRGRGRGGFYTIATYRFIPDQPTDEHMRTNEAWRTWCEARIK